MPVALGSFEFWTGWGAVGITAAGGIMIVIGTVLSALGQSVQQKEISDLARDNSRLSQQTLNSVIGSSEGYFVVFPDLRDINPKKNGHDTVGFMLNNISDYPMIDSSVMIFQATQGSSGDMIFGRNIGDLYEHTPGPLLNFYAPLRKDVDNVFVIIIRSRAVSWEEKLVVTWTGAMYEADYSMTRMDKDRDTTKFIRDDFPFIGPPRSIFPENWKKAKGFDEQPGESTPESSS